MIRVKVRDIARQKGISQRQLVIRSGLDIRVVQRVMRDPYVNIMLATLDRLAQTLGVDASELIESETDQPPQTPEKPS
jgi:transcriptional regulator with XRE-family HTH domain